MPGRGLYKGRSRGRALSRGQIRGEDHGDTSPKYGSYKWQEEQTDITKASLLAEKRAQLESVVNRHDALVREKFHMENFTMMLHYNPEEAKSDDSTVFQNYKSSYDLVDSVVPTLSRPTRKSLTEQRQFLNAPTLPSQSTQSVQKQGIPRPNLDSDLSGRRGGGHMAASKLNRKSYGELDSTLVSFFNKKGKRFVEDITPSSVAERRKSEASLRSNSHSPIERAVSSRRHTYKRRRSIDDSLAASLPPSPVSPKLKVKRIRLIVRPPPPIISNPHQRPLPSKHNYSLTAFLNSYINLDGEDVEEQTFQEKAAIDALLLERIEVLRAQGRFISDPVILRKVEATDPGPSIAPLQRATSDHWDSIIRAAVHHRESLLKRVSGPHIAGQIASRVRVYWDVQENKKERARQLEERYLRQMAKSIIRAVTNEWKKAVFHIREQERLRLEAEEVRRGHEHLDALLDQSGQLLVSQQNDLFRSDRSPSRSSSLSHNFIGEASEVELEHRMTEEEDDCSQDTCTEPSEEMSFEDENEDGCNEGSESGSGRSDGESANDTSKLLTHDVELNDSLGWSNEQDPSSQVVIDEHGGRIQPITGPSSGEEFDKETHTLKVEEVDAKSGSAAITRPSPSPSVSSISQMQEVSVTSAPSLIIHAQSDEIFSTHTSPDIGSLSPCSQAQLQNGSTSLYSTPDSSLATSTHVVGQQPHRELISIHSTFGALSLAHQSRSVATSDSDLQSHAGSLGNTEPHDDRESDWMARTCAESEDSSWNECRVSENVRVSNTLIKSEVDQATCSANIPRYLKPYAVAPVDWDPNTKIVPPLLLRGVLRPYQHSGLEWLASLHSNNLNGILADEMGLGKTIQTIALLAHLACDRGIWGPHLIIVPTSVLLNWEMEFKKFLPGFKVLSYHGSSKRRKELRHGWNDKHHFNVYITSYTLASRDAHIFKRKAWYYMILDEAHMIKNFRSQRWNILLMFRSFRRLLLTGTPLQNNLTELWALLQFLMSDTKFANLKEFGDWFSNPLEKAIEKGSHIDDDTMQRVSKLHTVLRPYLLRRLKCDVEKELPSKFEHLVLCPLSKRQRFLYDEFMSRTNTREALQSGVYQKIANILMQLRKVCNHPDLFEVRPIVTSFALERSGIADFEVEEEFIRRFMHFNAENNTNLSIFNLQFIDSQNKSIIAAQESRRLDASFRFSSELPGEPPPKDIRSISGHQKYSAYLQRAKTIARLSHVGYLNRLRCNSMPLYSTELLNLMSRFYQPVFPTSALARLRPNWEKAQLVNSMVKSYEERAEDMSCFIDRFAFATPSVVFLDLPRIALPGCEGILSSQSTSFDRALHMASVKLQIAFPAPSLLQYDCGKLQKLTQLLREKKSGGHRVLIFTQMTRVLDILEIFLNLHGYLYLRLDGATKIEDRQYITERFNADLRIFCFIASSRSGGVGINLTGADTVIFYDSDFNPQMDKQCEDRAHRIGQVRDVHIYRFVSQHTIEEALLQKANQKRFLDNLVLQKGEFDWRSIFNNQGALSKAIEEFEDKEDAHAAAVAAKEEDAMEGADEADFDGDVVKPATAINLGSAVDGVANGEHDNEGGTVADFMILFVERDYEYFRDWRI